MSNHCARYSHFRVSGPLLQFADSSPSLLMQLLEGHFKDNH